MLKNYFVITLRSLTKNKVSTIINLLGLSLGISSCLLIFLLIRYELNFDNFHSKRDRIFRIVKEEKNSSGTTYSASVPYPLNAALRNDYPELEGVAHIFEPEKYQVRWGEERWNQENILFADSVFFKTFDFDLISGNKEKALRQPNAALITESLAKVRFGGQSPIGQTLKLEESVEVEIVGVLKDPPKNTHLPFEIIVSIQAFTKDFVGGFPYDNWGTNIGFSDYIILPTTETQTYFEAKMKSLPSKYLSEESAKQIRFYLQPLKDIHTDPTFANSNPGYTVDTSYLWILGSVGFFILVLACINFINLSTAVAIRKSKEVGVRKVMGASRSQLVYQYLGEAFLVTLVSLLVALGVSERVVPSLNSFLGMGLELNLLNDQSLFVFLVCALIFVSFMSGVYPSWVLSSYKPVAALKNKINSHSGASLFLRKGLVTFQFVISQVLIIGTIVVASQMNFFRNKPLGFDKDYIVTASLSENDPGKLETLKSRLLANPSIQHVSFAVGVPTSQNDIGSSIRLEGSPDEFNARIKAVDYDYKETFGLELIAGEWFLHKEQAAKSNGYVLNETAVKELGFSSPEEALGKRIQFGLSEDAGPILGVVKDFHTRSLQQAIRPVVMLQLPKLYFEAGVKISNTNVPATIAFVKEKWEEAFPGYLFEYKFLDEALNANYSREQKIYELFKIFSSISIGIGCLGLFGLISFMVVQKTKEVGVRKVLGASVSGIVLLFSKDFIKLLAIAFLIAAPISWYAMEQWLNGFAYKVDILPRYFLWGGFINIFIALLTISYQAMRAAMVNPVESLRDE